MWDVFAPEEFVAQAAVLLAEAPTHVKMQYHPTGP